MKTTRYWKRESSYRPAASYGGLYREPEIRETVRVDIRPLGDAPVVATLKRDTDTFIIHNLLTWGELVMTRKQAWCLMDKLQEKLG